MKEQSQTPDLPRELVPEREYQRVTISGEEKCGVSQSGRCCDAGRTGRKAKQAFININASHRIYFVFLMVK